MNLFKNRVWTVTGILATSLAISASLLPTPSTPANPVIAATQSRSHGSSQFEVTSETTANKLQVPASDPTTDSTAITHASKVYSYTSTTTVGGNKTFRYKSSKPSPTQTTTPKPTPTTTSAPTTSPAPISSPSPVQTTTPTSTPTATPAPSPSSTPAGPWTRAYAQDFNTNTSIGNFGAVYGSNLLGYNNFTDTSGNGTYLPNQVLSTQNGYLDYYLRYINGKYATAAPMPQGNTGQTYGRYTMRFRADNIPGYKVAFLLWPDGDNWNNGEIDFPEAELGGPIYAYSHDVTGTPSRNAFAWNTNQSTTNWHTMSIEWAPDHLTYTIDGVSKTTTDKTAIPTKPMHLVLQAETDLNGIKPSTTAAGHVQVDYLTIDKYTP